MSSRPMDTYDRISIAEIVLYSIFLLVGVYLFLKHGIRRSSSWLYVIILSLARIIGSAMRLATISDPTNKDLYIGWQTLNGLGLGPLILIMLGLLGQCFDSINRQGREIVRPIFARLIQILMLVGIILMIIGGTKSNYDLTSSSPKVNYSSISKAGAGIMLVVYLLVVLTFLLVVINQGYVAQGEHRIIVVVAVSLPFIAVRLIYSCIVILGDLSGSVWLFLGAAVIMEILVVVAAEIVGLTLNKPPSVSPLTQQQSQELQIDCGYDQKRHERNGGHGDRRRRYPGLIGGLIRMIQDRS